MRKVLLCRLTAYALVLMAAVLGGCGSSPPSRFYHLASINGQDEIQQSTLQQDGKTVINVGPVRIPDYLDRPQIITRNGKNEFKLSEFNRWAGALENDIVRVLAENISAQLPPDRYFVLRWTPLLETQLPSTYRVEMIINRFEGALNGKVILSAQWGIMSNEKGMLFHKESNIEEPVAGKKYDVLVQAMSMSLEKLSSEIANAITTLEEQTSSK